MQDRVQQQETLPELQVNFKTVEQQSCSPQQQVLARERLPKPRQRDQLLGLSCRLPCDRESIRQCAGPDTFGAPSPTLMVPRVEMSE